jgi:hypothetical protein
MDNLAVWLDRQNVGMTAVLATIGVVIGAFVLSYLLKRPLRDSRRQLAARLPLPYETVLTAARLLIGVVDYCRNAGVGNMGCQRWRALDSFGERCDHCRGWFSGYLDNDQQCNGELFYCLLAPLPSRRHDRDAA